MKAGREATKIIEKYGFRVVRTEVSKHVHLYTEPAYMFVCPKTPGDTRWAKNFEEDVRTAAYKLKVPHPECPRHKCKNLYLVYEGDNISIHRCDVCNQSLFADTVKKVSTDPPRRWVIPSIPSSPSSGQSRPSKD